MRHAGGLAGAGNIGHVRDRVHRPPAPDPHPHAGALGGACSRDHPPGLYTLKISQNQIHSPPAGLVAAQGWPMRKDYITPDFYELQDAY